MKTTNIVQLILSDLFNTNASIVRDLAKAVADAAPEANVLVISNPVNSTVPICAEIFKSKNVYNPKRLFGVTTLDVVRASRFISAHKNTDPADENITVVGGHSGATIVPLLSQSGYSLSGKDLDDFVYRVQFGGDEVVKAKDGAGSATLSMAMAGARFAESLLKAAQGQTGVVEPTFVDSPLYKDQGIDFFSSKVELGPNGVEKIYEVGGITPKEQELLDAALKDLKGNIKKGTSFCSLVQSRNTRANSVADGLHRCRFRKTKPIGHVILCLFLYKCSMENICGIIS